MGQHPLIVGARAHFENARDGSGLFRNEYPRPLKRILVDVVVSKEGLDQALTTASKLFLALEDRGYSVTMPQRTQQWRRPEIDPQERGRARGSLSRVWVPNRPTLAYVRTVAFGLTLYELSEEAPATYSNKKWVRLSEAAAKKNRLLRPQWETTAQFPTGRFVLRAYSPYPGTSWTKEWRETTPDELLSVVQDIGDELLAAVPLVVEQVKEEERRAENRRKDQDEQQRKWAREEAERRRKEAEQRRAQAKKDSFNQLVRIIEDWHFARQMETFFKTAMEDAASLADEDRTALLKRLAQARQMFGGVDPLPHFRTWKTPEER